MAKKTKEIRCPVYGFIKLNDLEWEIVNQPEFQRLRKIRQLGWTDYVYPGAMHTRFEHSLGVMNMASLLFDGIVERSKDFLENEIKYDHHGLEHEKALVRIAALLHDIGHSPFSHAGEALFPYKDGGEDRFKHEDYSAGIVKTRLRGLIDDHAISQNHGITADWVAGLLEGKPDAKRALFWRDLISGQMDADCMDYLLRDSHHAGVSYGVYDWHRLAGTIRMGPWGDDRQPRIGVEVGGMHAVDALILARYFMFTQVYFHKTRVAYDHHIQNALAEILPNETFPPPTKDGLEEYLEWDDWRVLGKISEGKGGKHGERLKKREHFREIIHTQETPYEKDLEEVEEWKSALGDLLETEESARKSWYSSKSLDDIPIIDEEEKEPAKPLSQVSSVVKDFQNFRKISLFVRPENVKEAKKRLNPLHGRRPK